MSCKRRKKGALPLIAGVVILAVFLYVAGSGLVPGILVPAEGVPSGFTTLGLNKADFVSSSEFFNEETFILYVSQFGMGQYATGTVTTDEINQETGKAVEDDFKIDISFSKQACEYPIDIDYNQQRIQQLEMKTYGCLIAPSMQEAQDQCASQNVLYYGKFAASFECFCIYSPEDIWVGTLNNPEVHTKATVTAGGASKSIDTRGSIRGYVGSNVYVKWDGYKSTAMPCDSQAQILGAYDGSWKTISQSKYDTYKNYRQALETYVYGSYGKDQVESAVNNVNSAANSALSPVYFGSVSNPTSVSDGYVVKDVTEGIVQIPTYVFYVKADYLKIYQPVGKPQITNIHAPDFGTGDEGTVTVEVKNIGDEREGFDVSLNCPSPFRVSAAQNKVITPGSSSSFYMKVYGDTNARECKTCTATASAIGGTDSKSFSLCIDPQRICQANTYTCENNNVMKCNAEGSELLFIKSCASDEECTIKAFTGEAYCKKIGSDEDGTQANVNWLMVLLGSLIMVVIVLAVVALLPPLRPLLAIMLNPVVLLILFAVFFIVFAGIALSVAELVVGSVVR